MNYSYNEILFLDFDKAKSLCKICRAQNLNNRSLKNKNKILDKITRGKIDLFIIKQTKPCYNECVCALTHFDKPCMRECLSNKKDLSKKIEDCTLWSLNAPE